MIDQLRRNIINLKSLDQDISDKIIAGAGEAGGPQLYVILTEEAAARFTPVTKLYLSWKHLDLENVRGYDMFEKISDKPNTWAIKWPRNMKHEGIVEACLEIVDNISIDQSQHFHIEVLSDLESTDSMMDENEYDLFHKALIEMNEKLAETWAVHDSMQQIYGFMSRLYQQMRQDYANMLNIIINVDDQTKELKQEWDKVIKTIEDNNSRIKQLEEQTAELYSFHGRKYSPLDKQQEFGYLKFKGEE